VHCLLEMARLALVSQDIVFGMMHGDRVVTGAQPQRFSSHFAQLHVAGGERVAVAKSQSSTSGS
jgi:hypothetical protein